MGFFIETAQQLKNAFKPKLNWREIGSSVKGSFRNRDEVAVVMRDSDVEEFKLRYRNLRVTSIASLVFMAIAFLSILLSANFKDFFYSLMATMLFGMFYFRYSYMLWVCRSAFLRGADLSRPVSETGANFWGEVMASPATLMPLPLPDERTQKGASK